ncbi:ribonuclease R [Hominifimenecus sp. rT4P-3]|uniref:ribonuclease R n=1 Tax=Hominifimenecus sp. rT4P-3 TaxID=3242979 RepID=UPI003DA36302
MEEKELEIKKKHVEALIFDPQYRPMKIKELAILLGVPRERREELKAVLDALLAEGRIGLSKRGKYGRPEETALTGIFSGTSRGFGFVAVEGWPEDIYIPEKDVNGALHGDKVKLVALEGRHGRRPEGKILAVLERNITSVVGVYQKKKHFGFVIPDNSRMAEDVFIPEGKDLGAVSGHKVVVELTKYGDKGHQPEGRITEILGHRSDPGVDVLSVLRAYGIPEEFPPEVMEQAAMVGTSIEGERFPERMDLRELLTVTIDGEDAKDLDDAVTISRTEKGYCLGVHIADVSHYVTEGSPMDEEAKRRGTSVYVTDRVVPMLPRRLSNGICSLNQGEDRLALSCLMELDEQGTVIGHQIEETLLRVDRRMTYTAVEAVLSGEEEACREHAEFVEMFQLMEELAGKLRAKRRKRGSIDFDLPETKIRLDEKGYPVEICPYERNRATDIIEDFMLIANETVAEDAFWQELPFLYRVHEEPDPDKILELTALIRGMGGKLRSENGKVHPKELQKMLAAMEDSPEESFVSRLALRSMKQARYSPACTGHFGLAAKYYCHFTSPIRRYPDLQIHRILKENQRGTLDERRMAHYHSILQEVASLSSTTERRAAEAERTVNRQKMAQFMRSHIGEYYDGLVSGVTRWGIYVELPNTVEGLVHVSRMDLDYFYLDEKNHQLIGERTGRVYRMGQPVRVQVTGVDLDTSTIDFRIEEQELEWEKKASN